MLSVKDLHAYYGKSHILQGVSLDVGEGEIVSLLGRNGVGRSTTLKAIIGEVAPSGEIHFKGKNIAGRKSHVIARKGIGYVPENREIFPTLTVRQNLNLFPNLRERADISAGVLSGGEQQMLTICRTLMGDPDLIMIDEPTEGLAPQNVERVKQLIEKIAARGVSILLVEQKLTIALQISTRIYVMGHGRIVFEGKSEDLRDNADIRKEWLEV
jgi:branched-chain amino acid transport system ATP-binding protein